MQGRHNSQTNHVGFVSNIFPFRQLGSFTGSLASHPLPFSRPTTLPSLCRRRTARALAPKGGIGAQWRARGARTGQQAGRTPGWDTRFVLATCLCWHWPFSPSAPSPRPPPMCCYRPYSPRVPAAYLATQFPTTTCLGPGTTFGVFCVGFFIFDGFWCAGVRCPRA